MFRLIFLMLSISLLFKGCISNNKDQIDKLKLENYVLKSKIQEYEMSYKFKRLKPFLVRTNLKDSIEYKLALLADQLFYKGQDAWFKPEVNFKGGYDLTKTKGVYSVRFSEESLGDTIVIQFSFLDSNNEHYGLSFPEKFIIGD